MQRLPHGLPIECNRICKSGPTDGSTCIFRPNAIRKSVRVFSNLFESFRIFSSPFESFRILSGRSDPFGSFRVFSCLFESFRVLSDPLGSFRILSGPFGSFRVLSDPFGSFRVFSGFFGSFRILSSPRCDLSNVRAFSFDRSLVDQACVAFTRLRVDLRDSSRRLVRERFLCR